MNERDLLEHLVVDNSELEQLEDVLSQFNIFEVLDLQQHEIRHSNFLAWLLDPNGTHSLGSYFLKRFLSKTSSLAKSLQIGTLTPVDVDIWDLSETVVLRERDRIDILLLNEPLKFVCAIENKVFSQEHGNQLLRYRRLLDQNYSDFTRHYLLLSREGDAPEEDIEQQYWVPISYGMVCQLVEHATETKASTLSEEVQIFVHHYTAMLRRHILEDSQIQQLAKKIYERHRKAIDIIYEYRPDTLSQIRQIIEEEIQAVPSLSLGPSSKSYIRFLPEGWRRFSQLKKGVGWPPSDHLLLFEFKNFAQSLKLVLVLGPGEYEVRKAIFDLAKEQTAIFRLPRRELSQKWNTLYSKDLLLARDYEDVDLESMKSKIHTYLESFVADGLPKIINNIDQCFSGSQV